MKTFVNLNAYLLCFALLLASCSETDTVEIEDSSASNTEEVQLSAEMDQLDSVLADILIESQQTQENSETDRLNTLNNLPDCVIINVQVQQNYREITLNFGDDGCEVYGHILKGSIVFDYTRNPQDTSVLINYNLVNFYFNDKQVIGNRTILREFDTANGNPMFTHNLDVTVIWPNGQQATRQGTRVREWIEGFGSGTFNDNVFLVTGNWTSTFVNGNTRNFEVVTPLRREVICPHFVSGTLDIQSTNFGGVLNYGDGQCDNAAILTLNNGNTITLTL